MKPENEGGISLCANLLCGEPHPEAISGHTQGPKKASLLDGLQGTLGQTGLLSLSVSALQALPSPLISSAQ